MKGIDVSYANSQIHWEEAKKEIDFAIIRSSFGSDMPSQVDNCFEQNVAGCISNHIPFGIYHFAYFINEATARAEADFAIRLANQYHPHIHMIALDIEEDSEDYANRLGCQPDWTKCAETFLERVREAGYQPVLYTNYSWMTYRFDYAQLKQYPLWLASPDASPDIPARYDNIVLWQNSWSGHISGIAGPVDTDICYCGKLFTGQSTGTGSAIRPDTQVSPDNNRPDNGHQEEIHQLSSSSVVYFQVKVTSLNGVNLRSGAGTSYTILGAVPYGETLTITRRTTGGGYTWGLTQYGSLRGWIALDFTRKVTPKSVDTLAKEVIRGEWDSGEERERLLTQAGYDYQAVQNRVNQLMRK